MKKIIPSCLIAVGLGSSIAHAHSFSEMTLPPEGFHAHLSLSGAYRSDALVKSNEKWTIPGTLMGGEALPSEAGLGLDEVFLTPIYRQDQTYVLLKFGRHMGSEDLELDHVLLGHQLNDHFAIEGGKMAAIFTPFNGEHASDTSFSARRLVYDALWGAQYNDQGIRFKTQILGLDAGLELWKGDSFPAKQKDTNKSAYDLYVRASLPTSEALKLQVGAYYYAADAAMRDDARYSSTHSHAQTVITTDPTYFDGTVETKGVTGVIAYEFAEKWSTGFQGEVSQIQQNGRLWDATHTASFKNETLGLWGEAFIGQGQEKLSLRSERLKVKNDIYGSAAQILSDKLKLLGTDQDPYRHTVSLEHNFNANFRSRLEWSKDFSTAVKTDIYTLSGVWSGMIFHSGPG